MMTTLFEVKFDHIRHQPNDLLLGHAHVIGDVDQQGEFVKCIFVVSTVDLALLIVGNPGILGHSGVYIVLDDFQLVLVHQRTHLRNESMGFSTFTWRTLSQPPR